jgi:hypothetical protein
MSRDAGYVPLDISSLCNAGVSVMDPDGYSGGGTYLEPRPATPPLGHQSFHGLPFSIGDDPERCFVAFRPETTDPVRVPIGRIAHHVIVAHAIVDTELWRGAAVGAVVARYRFAFDDGEVLEVPVRERLEIGHVPMPWGQYPFLAVPDQQDFLEPRWAGRWNRAGFRITEVGWPVPQGYYLWAWRNPRPEVALTDLEVRPAGHSFLIAAVTLGSLDEEPFCRSARVPVRITLLDPTLASAPFATELDVDRGSATYTQPLPSEPLELVEPHMRGFGAPANPTSSPVYAEVAATPSATVSVLHGSKVVAEAGWEDLERGAVVETPRARIEVVENGRNWVRVTVVDAATGRPVPCRIAFHSEAGVPYAPHGHHAHVFSNLEGWNVDVGGDVRLGQITYAVIDGRCEGWLPRGRVTVDVARGFEYEPIRQTVEIVPGQTELTVELERWIDMNDHGWWSGDTHVHFLSAVGALNEARSEDLNVVNLLQAQWGHLFTSIEDFTGEPLRTGDGRHVVWVSQENRQHILGHLGLLGLRRPVMPWSSGGPTEAELGGSLEVTLSHWADAAHAQGGTVIASHFPTPNGEPATLVATGRVDAVEMLDFLDYEHREYYRYLNAGYRLPLVGGTDKMANTTPVGLYRTYARLQPDEEFGYEAWLGAVRAGRTFLSGGALLWFTVDGHQPGETIDGAGGRTVEVEAVARSIFPIHTLQVVQEGVVVAETAALGGAREVRLEASVRVDGDTWLAARCAGPGYTSLPHHDDRRRSIIAHTSPVYIASEHEYRLRHPESLQYLLTLVEGGLEYVRRAGRHYPADRVTHHHGLDDHLEYLARPFHEARQALASRMQEGTPR